MADLDNELYESQRNLTDLQNANASINSNVDQFKSESAHNLKAAQAEVMKNNDLVKRLKQAENTLRIRTLQVTEGN